MLSTNNGSQTTAGLFPQRLLLQRPLLLSPLQLHLLPPCPLLTLRRVPRKWQRLPQLYKSWLIGWPICRSRSGACSKGNATTATGQHRLGALGPPL